MTQEIKVLCGIPASGKSTFALKDSAYMEEENKTTAVISRDAIRFSMLKDGEDYFAHEKETFEEFVRQINECIECGVAVIYIDASHLNAPSRNKILSRVHGNKNITLSFEVFMIDEQLALERNSFRQGRACVPASAIRNMLESFHAPTKEECNKYNKMYHMVHINYHPQRRD